MFGTYLEQQQRQLESLGEAHARQRRLLDQQRARLQALQGLAEELGRPVSGTALYHQNRNSLRGQIGSLLLMQEQETEMAELSCDHSLALMRRQLGRVKGLEQIHQRRGAERDRQQARREQHALDDWAGRVAEGPALG